MRSLLLLFLILLTAVRLPAQKSNLSFTEHPGSFIDVDHQHVPWPSPEVMVADLRSADDQIRLKALQRLGLTDAQAYRDVWSDGTPSKMIGKKLIMPDKVQLTYAALGSDATQQAILAVEYYRGGAGIVAIARPAAHGWQRIAQISSEYRYFALSGDPGSDAMSTFVKLGLAPGSQPPFSQHYELIVRESDGGGSGLFVQDEARFRVHDCELREVLSFTSRQLSCQLTCTLERRWFNWASLVGDPGGMLVEGHGEFSDQLPSRLLDTVPDLETRRLQHFTCTRINWNEQRFRYELVKGADHLCKVTAP